MKNYFYELAVVFPPAIETEKEKHYEKIRKLLASLDCEMLAEDHWGRTKFAYPIKKETDGFYSFFSFKGENTVPRKIADEFRVDELILRHLLVKKPMSKLKKETPFQPSFENNSAPIDEPESTASIEDTDDIAPNEPPVAAEEPEPVVENAEQVVGADTISVEDENPDEIAETAEAPLPQQIAVDESDENTQNEQVNDGQKEN